LFHRSLTGDLAEGVNDDFLLGIEIDVGPGTPIEVGGAAPFKTASPFGGTLDGLVRQVIANGFG
jgi:hypothetical protein